MSNKIKIDITIEYEDNVTEPNRVAIDHRIDALLAGDTFELPDNVAEESDYTVDIMRD